MFEGREVAAILVAAGRSTRMGFDKLFHKINDVEILRLSLEKLDAHPAIDSLVIVAGENEPAVQELFLRHPPQKPFCIVRGGATRTDSVAAGLQACQSASLVAIHDAARPFVSEALITRTLVAAAAIGAAAPAVPLKDTVKEAEHGFVLRTMQRSTLAAVQTPQIFDRAALVAALADIPPEEYAALTDDCMIIERAGLPVRLVEGEEKNRKITTAEDLPEQKEVRSVEQLRIGHGYDVHRLVEERKLILGGVEVPFEKGLQGHSDADVLLHALADALLGAAALGDIGRHFPDNDPAYQGADSLVLLQKTVTIIRQAGFAPVNLDATILCQRPRLAPYIPAMRRNIAAALGLKESSVSVKATTEEGLGFTGVGEGMAAHCVVLVAAQ